MSKLNLQNILSEMTNDEFRDAEEADRLESHPERDMIKKIQALIRNEKNKSIDPNSAAVDKDGNIKDKTAGEFAESSELDETFKTDGSSEDSVDNIDKVASPDAKASDYDAAIGSERSEDDKEQSDITQTTKPMYEDMNLMSLAKKLGIDVDDLKDKVNKMKSKEKDEIEASARASMAEARVDRDVAERIEGMLNIPLKRKFLDSFMDVWQDLIEEDPFYAEDVINHLNNEMHKEIDGYQAAGDRLAGLGEDNDPSGAYLEGDPDEKVMGENGDVEDYAEEIKEDSSKDLLDKIRKHLKGSDRNFQDNEIEMYIDSLRRDIKRGEFDGVESQSMEDHEEDLLNYIDDKALQEHFGRFLKDYQ